MTAQTETKNAGSGTPESAGTAPDKASLVLTGLILVAAVANLNLSVANVALPSIGAAFESSTEGVATPVFFCSHRSFSAAAAT